MFSDFNVPTAVNTEVLDDPEHGTPCPDSGFELSSSLFCVQIGHGAHSASYKMNSGVCWGSVAAHGLKIRVGSQIPK